jgi:hypothetical protein
MTQPEIATLSDQLDEILSTGVDDEEEALEVAALAGLLDRLGADPARTADAVAWRRGGGAQILSDALDALDLEAYVADLDDVAQRDATDDEVIDAVYAFDEVVAAATWSGRRSLVAAAAAEVERTVRMIPEPFACLAEEARTLARSREVAGNLDVYGYWLAIADAGR